MATEPLEAQAPQGAEPFEARQIRLARNQSLFRAVNDQIEYFARARATVLPFQVLCECADPDCDAQVELTQGEYEAVRQNPTQFFVLPDHVFPEFETIVERRGHYVIVEKFRRLRRARLTGRRIGFLCDLGGEARSFAHDPILDVLGLDLLCLIEVMSRPQDKQRRIPLAAVRTHHGR